VVGRSGGSPEAVVAGETGAVVDAADPAELAHALNGLLDDPAAARRMGEAGRRWVCANWSWDRAAARLAALLRGAPADQVVRPGPRIENAVRRVSPAWDSGSG
jgi:phosphatidylinositol alpha-1,6-mannosyltransferase